MADLEAFSTSFRAAVKRLPPELVLTWVEQGIKHFDVLKKEMPNVISEMKPHGMALMMEFSMGAIDKAEFERVVKLTFLDILRDLAADPAIINKLDSLVPAEG